MPLFRRGRPAAFFAIILSALLCSCASTSAPRAPVAPAADPAKSLPKALSRAADLRRVQRFEEARQVYEAWLAQHPDDPDPVFELGYTLYLEACAEPAPAKAKELRLRARDLLVRSRQLGSKLPDLLAFDQEMTAEGDDARHYDALPAAADLIRQGELAFSGGKFEAALALYQQALTVDRRAYAAALFSGDVYFNQKNYAKANEWFSKAVGINPNTETAFRYWGDSLVRQGRPIEARERYLEAIVAEPYNRLPHTAFTAFASATHLTLHHPAIKRFVAKVELIESGPKISLDPDHNDALTVAYALARAKWLTEDRSKYFPKDSPSRHSLPEEAEALRVTIQIARELSEKDAEALAGWKETFDTLASLDRSGLLEAYILFDAADEGIAKDYDSYRFQHREQLLRYLREIRCAERDSGVGAKN